MNSLPTIHVTLPACRWRSHSQQPGKIFCNSLKWAGNPPKLLDASFCAEKCPKAYVDHEPIAAPVPATNGKPATLEPCVHRGIETGETVECPTCSGTVKLKVLACEVHGKCTVEKPVEGVQCCKGCPDYSTDKFRFVAPLGKRDLSFPEKYRVTVTIPHLATPEFLFLAMKMWRKQSIPAYFVIVDTGSPASVCRQLETLRGEDCEVHYVRAGAYIHSSAPVGVATDLAFSVCPTNHLFTTHSDVFPRRRDFLEVMLHQCYPNQPVVGWQMSDRGWITPSWEGCVSHTATMWHLPTMRRIGLTWNFRHWYENATEIPKGYGWPDTETVPNLVLQRAGIKPKLLGSEPNWQLQETEWFWHARSTTCTRLQGGDKAPKVTEYGKEALAKAHALLMSWENPLPVVKPTRLNLGGGGVRKEGFATVDKRTDADVVFDFETLAEGARLPFDDDSIDEVFSSHCFEHIRAIRELLREVVRVAKIGAKVEIVVPHHFSQQAMCHDHKHTISNHQVQDWLKDGIEYWFGLCVKRFELTASEQVPGRSFNRWQEMLPCVDAQDILDLCPDACFESRWTFRVIPK
jgi:SAM-dependent methyltransferase